MPKQSKAQKDTVERVMHEFKHGELKANGGRKVKHPKQAIAIALSEAGASDRQSPKENEQHLRRTKAKERAGKTGKARADGGSRGRTSTKGGNSGNTRAELYGEAKRRHIPGRSKMSKAQLQRALSR
jgi:hypothetical protein